MRVLLINPSRAGKGNIPINIPILYAVLKREGHSVRIFDFTDYKAFQPEALVARYREKMKVSGGKWDRPELYFKKTPDIDLQQLRWEREAFFQRQGIRNVEDRLLQVLNAGNPLHDLDRMCSDWQPEVVAISSLTVDYPVIMQYVAPLKSKYGFHLVSGGIHAITLPDHAVHYPAVDAICTGDGEKAITEYLEQMENGGEYWKTPNMWVRYNGRIFRNPLKYRTEMDMLPYLDFDGFDPVHFYRPFQGRLYRMLNYEWGRGCPYACSYCENVVLHEIFRELNAGKSPVRRKPVRRSIEELKYLIRKYSFEFIRFWDEDFTSVSEESLEEYAALYKSEIGLPFLIYSRFESVSERKVKLLKDMGCRMFAMGIESGSETIRYQVLNRKIRNKRILSVFNLVKENGISLSAYNILGLPGENREQIFETIRLNRAAPLTTSSCTLLEPYPATPIRAVCEADGFPEDTYPGYDCFLGHATYVPSGMDRAELEGLFRTFNLYVHLPENFFQLIRVAEENSETGRLILDLLQEIKMEYFNEMPVYPEKINADVNPGKNAKLPGITLSAEYRRKISERFIRSEKKRSR